MDFPKSVPGVGLVDGKFVDENQTTGQAGSLIPSAWGNAVTEELLNVILAAGLEPSEEQQDQLLKAVRKLRGGAVNFGMWQFSAAGGSPGAGRVTLNNGDPALASALLIAESSAEALDYSSAFGQLRAGDTVSLFERDNGAVAHRYRVTGAAGDNGSYRTVPVAYVSGGGGLAPDAVLSVLLTLSADNELASRVSALEARPRGVGDGQSWQDFSASRLMGTTYTNTTGRPIQVQAWAGTNGTTNFLSLSVNGSTASYMGISAAGSGSTVSATVPAGATYAVNGSSVTLQKWMELR